MRQGIGGVRRAGRAGLLAACLGGVTLVGCGQPAAPVNPGGGPVQPTPGGAQPPGGVYSCEFLAYYSWYNFVFGYWENIPYWQNIGTLGLGAGTYHWQGAFYGDGDGTFVTTETTGGSDHFTLNIEFTNGPLQGRVLGGFEPGPLTDLLGEERPNQLLLAELGEGGQPNGASLNCFGPYQ